MFRSVPIVFWGELLTTALLHWALIKLRNSGNGAARCITSRFRMHSAFNLNPCALFVCLCLHSRLVTDIRTSIALFLYSYQQITTTTITYLQASSCAVRVTTEVCLQCIDVGDVSVVLTRPAIACNTTRYNNVRCKQRAQVVEQRCFP